jgi:hypothetical protein
MRVCNTDRYVLHASISVKYKYQLTAEAHKELMPNMYIQAGFNTQHIDATVYKRRFTLYSIPTQYIPEINRRCARVRILITGCSGKV